GAFHTYNFQTIQGVLQALSGTPFHYLFFSEGLLPSVSQLSTTASWFWQNYLGIGFLIGLMGIFFLVKRSRGLFLCWLALFVPYTYFYTCYGAADRSTMFGPS